MASPFSDYFPEAVYTTSNLLNIPNGCMYTALSDFSDLIRPQACLTLFTNNFIHRDN